MPVQSFTYNLQALINFELFSYTLKLASAINALVETPESLPPAMQETMVVSSPELYIDFTNESNRLNKAMAAHCVRREIETCQRFLWSNLMLRQLHAYVQPLRKLPSPAARIEAILEGTTDGPKYLQGLLQLRFDPSIGALIESRATTDEQRIQAEYALESGEEDAESLAGLDEVAAGCESFLERVITLLVEGQRKKALEHYIGWFWSVGGLTKPHGILAGDMRSRLSWRYAPSNDLLAVLVQLAAIRQPGRNTRDAFGGVGIQPIRLQDFLAFLERRFGILVDRPPAPYTGAEAAAAARENLQAMLRRLRQMGIFSDLSDDFTVQRLQPPYANVNPARAEV